MAKKVDITKLWLLTKELEKYSITANSSGDLHPLKPGDIVLLDYITVNNSFENVELNPYTTIKGMVVGQDIYFNCEFYGIITKYFTPLESKAAKLLYDNKTNK